jgi:thioredoxin reductase
MTKTEAHNLLDMVKNGILIETHRIRKALVLTGDIPNVLGRTRKQNGGTLRTNGDQQYRTFEAHGEVFSEGLS